MKAPEISVLVPVRNGANFIEDVIKSVINQTFTDWTLIVKDNFSSDDTCKIVRRYAGVDPRIELVERDRDVGACENYNSCVREVKTKYYLALSHDDFLYSPTALEKAYNILESHPSVPKVHSDMMFVDEHSNAIMPRHFKRQGLVDSDFIGKKSIVTVRNLYGIPLLLRSETVRGHQYDQAFPYTSDIDFSITVGKGMLIYHIPEILIALRIHSKNATHGRFDKAAKELRICAIKHRIELSVADRLLMLAYDYYQRFAKFLFYVYLMHVRKSEKRTS